MDLPSVPLLLVEDEPDLREALSEYLEACGFEVTGADSARQALQVAAEREPRIIITDLSLPDVRGEVFLQDFLALHPACMAYIHSGDSNFEPSSELVAAGFHPKNVIPKPADLTEMVLRLRNDLLFP